MNAQDNYNSECDMKIFEKGKSFWQRVAIATITAWTRKREQFRCPECGDTRISLHLRSKDPASPPAHFEHISRNKSCSRSIASPDYGRRKRPLAR
jgi:predicted RNA-binding Zn-ribbon protein involved in translation (DUF1610 family)